MDKILQKITTRKSNTDEFIKKSENIHGDKYDYSLVEYKNNNTKVKIICKIHGEFEQIPRSHTSGIRCSKCSLGTITSEIFIKKSNKKHRDKYDYSEVNESEFQNTKPVKIICTDHGPFFLEPRYHLNGVGCSKCSGNRKLTTEEFILRSKDKYSKYDYNYDKTIYNGYFNDVTMTCKKHGDFVVNATSHLNGVSHCNLCSSRKKWDFDYFIENANKIHNNKYKYDKSTYVNSAAKTKITCEKHGDFWQLPESHIRGMCGCPTCRESKGEVATSVFLTENNIEYVRHKKFDDCRHIHVLEYDFYLPELNLCIEYDGIQHFEPRERFGGQAEFEKIQIRDGIKNKYCENNNIQLVRISSIKGIPKKLNFLL